MVYPWNPCSRGSPHKFQGAVRVSAAESVQNVGVRAFLAQLLAVAVGADRDPTMDVPGSDGLFGRVAIPFFVSSCAYSFFTGIGTRRAMGARSIAAKVEAMVGGSVGQGLGQVGVLPTGGGGAIRSAIA